MPWVNADLWSAHTQQVKNATTILSTNPPADARDRRAHKWSGLFKFVLNAFRDEKEQIESSANVAMTATYVGRPHQSFRYVIWINLKRFLTLGIFSASNISKSTSGPGFLPFCCRWAKESKSRHSYRRWSTCKNHGPAALGSVNGTFEIRDRGMSSLSNSLSLYEPSRKQKQHLPSFLSVRMYSNCDVLMAILSCNELVWVSHFPWRFPRGHPPWWGLSGEFWH